TLELQWERKAIPMKISVPKMTDIYISQIERELQSSPGFDPDNYAIAANYLLQENYNLDKALMWADQASEPPTGVKTFNSVTTKGNVLFKKGMTEDALSTYAGAMEMADATPCTVHQLGRNLIGMGEKEMALKVFKMNYDKNKGAWPTNVGMARGLSAVGKYDEALTYAQAALVQAPDDMNKNSLTKIVEKLKAKQDFN
ncbi:MAG: tetratricopeptide repeat protein, partial [Saprospiraceae bacterium]